MLDLSKINGEHFSVKLENGTVLALNPPKVSVLNKIMALSGVDKADALETYNRLLECTEHILSSNKDGKKIKREFVEEHFDLMQMQVLLTEYLKWVMNVRHDPN